MTGEQQWQTYQPDDGRGTDPEQPERPVVPDPPTPPYGAKQQPVTPTRATGRRGRGPLAVVALLGVPVLAVGGLAVGIFALVDNGVPGIGSKPDALSEEGLDELVADIEERSGGTEVFQAVIYPDYAVLDVPVDGTSQREESLYWDGGFDDFGGKGTSPYTRFDLAEVDAAVLTDAIDRAKDIVEDPTSWYVIIDGPTTSAPDSGELTITAHASNEFSESGAVEVTFDGTEVRTYDSTAG